MKLSQNEYLRRHRYVWRNYSKTGKCEACGSVKRTEWSNKSGNYMEEVRLDWQELCKKCHYKYDTEVLGAMTMTEKGKLGGLKKVPKGFAVSGKAREAGIKSGIARRKKL